ncbi:MAG: protein kinase [Chloroflexi bacterium]|nr:protein kinase [Chloroflexota bacterium]
MSDDLIGRTLGKYELRERIGRGGMAEVYKAYHPTLDRYVALKILHPFLSEDPEFRDRFGREARNIAQLRHPNIVQVYDFDEEANRELFYMVMEYIDGPTLRTRLMQLSFQGERFTIPEAISITQDIGAALAYAHNRDMIHRDIKPANVMIDSDGRTVLTDFGIARIVSGPNMTASGSMVGTPAYMSPEQGLGQPGDHRSDIYSLGVLLYQMVTGSVPFDADTPIAIVLKHVNDPLPAPTELNPDIPEGLERILYKALTKDPSDRYQRIDDMISHLDNLAVASTIILPPRDGLVGKPSIERPKLVEEDTPAFDKRAEDTQDLRSRRTIQRWGCLNWLIVLTLSFAALGSGAYLSFNGALSQAIPMLPSVELILTATPNPDALVEAETEPTDDLPAATPTENLEATQIAATLEALSQLVNTPEADEPTPDLTATVIACDYDYEVVSQTPENAIPYPEVTSLTKRVVVLNDSRCPLDDDSRLEFIEGDQMDGPDFVEFNQDIEPGEEFEIVLNLRTPAYTVQEPIVRSVWRMVLPDGTQVGPPLVFEFTLFQE